MKVASLENSRKQSELSDLRDWRHGNATSDEPSAGLLGVIATRTEASGGRSKDGDKSGATGRGRAGASEIRNAINTDISQQDVDQPLSVDRSQDAAYVAALEKRLRRHDDQIKQLTRKLRNEKATKTKVVYQPAPGKHSEAHTISKHTDSVMSGAGSRGTESRR